MKRTRFLQFTALLCAFLSVGSMYAQTTVNFAAGTKNVAIPDGTYNGTLASMGTSAFTVAGVPTTNVAITSVTLTTNINHTWVGDVVIKLQAPDGKILGLMSRPGLTEPNDGLSFTCCGFSSDFVSGNPIKFVDGAALSAEALGSTATPIPAGDAAPAPGAVAQPPGSLAALAAGLSNNVNGTWRVYAGDGAGGDAGTIVDATLSITYKSTEPCVLTCPANMTINLDPGACDEIVNYEVTFKGDCSALSQAPFSITQNLNPNIIQDALDCNGSIPTSQWRNYPALPGSFTINQIRMASFFAGQAKAYVYSYTGPLNGATLDLAQMTLLGESANVVTNGQQFTNIPINVTVPANTAYVVRLQKVAGAGFVVAANYAGQTAPSYITCEVAGINTPTNYANFGFGFIHVIQILSGTTAQLSPPNLVQISGIPSGGTFPRGTTKNCYQLQNKDTGAKIAECCFDVVVKEFPNPIKTLICNDLVNFTVDANCTGTVGADQVLEGGPYGCYTDYIVDVDKTAPFGNGPWVPAVFGPADIGKTYQVRVTDPENLNNRCWGDIKVEDKLPPVLNCPTYTVACNTNLTNPFANSTIVITPQTTFSQFGKVNIIDNQTVQSNLNVPASGSILDVNVKIDIDHTWVGDLDIIVESPAGTQVKLWDNLCNLTDNLKFTNDDESTICSNLCADYNNGGMVLQTISCLGLAPTDLSAFDGENLNGTWKLIVNDNTAGDNGVINEFSLIITYKSFFQGVTAATATDGCSAVNLTFSDTEVQKDCASGLIKTINRKWTATDASGNSKTCVQVINVARGTNADLVFPPDYDGIDAPFFVCNGAYPTPQWIASQPNPAAPGTFLQGSILLYGANDGCSINWQYVDTRINVCAGTYKIRRVWTIINWCTGTSSEFVQLIKVVDNVGPAIACPANMTATTDPFTCCGSVDLPNVIIEDVCSNIASISAMVIVLGDPNTGNQGDTLAMHTVGGFLSSFPGNNLWDRDTLGNFGTTPCLPIGRHTVVYTATDDCGNTTTCTFRLNVADFTPPVAACDEFTTVAIGIDDPYDCYLPSASGCEFAGVTWIKAKTFDDGSYDNCNNIRFRIRRMGPFSDCINALNPVNGHPECDQILDPFPDIPSEFERAITTEYDSIKFYCCEVGTTQTVVLTVYQVDANGVPAVAPDGSLVANECMIQVEVQDKIKPVCQSPANVTVSCENFDPSLWAYGRATVYDNCCLDTSRVYQGQCGLSHSASYTQFDTLCNRGTITRTFRVFDCHGQQSQCTQRILVNYEQDYFVRFPDDRIVTVCDGTGNFGEPTFLNKDCELLGVSFTDEVFTVVPDACYKIERTWHVINWCQYNANLPLTVVPNPNPNATVNSPANNAGPVISSSSNPNVLAAPWTATRVAITPPPPTVPQTDYSVFYLGGTYVLNGQTISVPAIGNSNGFSYKQIIKVLDTQDPTFTNCPASPVTFCDLTPNDGNLWNESYWYDNATMSHNLCEGPADLNITATDACSGSNINIKYLLFLDTDNNGSMETVISSTNLPGFNNVQYNNANGPGTAQAFDERPVPSNQKYGFALQTTVSGNNKTGAVRWNTFQSQNTYVVPELPYGTHKIKWVVEDGCGNEAICEYTFIVKDCKAPTVVCINGLSVNIMPTGMIQLWASDFLQYTEDNCTPANKLQIAIRRVGAADGQGNTTGFPRNADGTPQTNVAFTCQDLGTKEVELWSIDLAGNADFCVTYVIIQDNNGNCGTAATVAGILATEAQAGLEDATVTVSGSSQGIPPYTKSVQSDNTGFYEFLKSVPMGSNFTVTPTNDNNPLNGVSTYDLVLISKHILGLEPLSSEFKMISADANKSGSITTFDIVELRKLILGIYTELPNNTSWRFVDKKFSFPDPANPFKTAFPENITVADIQLHHLADHFTAMKIGDVNGSATANSLMASEDRTAGTLMFDVEDRTVKAGEEFEVSFKAASASQGYQMTMNLNGLTVADIVSSDKVTAANFGILGDALTVSVDGAQEFAVRFRAAKGGKLSEMLGVSSRITKAEAYTLGNERQEVALRFNSGVISGVGFELYQNEPNPFVSKTFIGFHLPEAATATLTVYDESGRVLFTQKGDFAKGYNSVAVDRASVGAAGVLYYKVETATDSATKKMIQTK